VIVDDDGIAERRNGALALFIPWHQVERLGIGEVRSVTGAKILLRLSRDRCRDFYRCASAAWRDRFPERWHHNRQRSIRAGAWAAYFWLPLLTLGPCVAYYILFWLLGSPEHMREGLQKVHRLTLIGVICVVPLALWYAYRTRNAAEPSAPPNGGPATQVGTSKVTEGPPSVS
jgi:hypothetical protein